MTIRTALSRMIAVTLLLIPVMANSQVAPGIYANGAFDTKGFDTINLGNLNSHFSIPIFAKPGRGGMNFSYSLAYDSAVWTPLGVSGSQTWQPSPTWGWTSDTDAVAGYFTYASQLKKCYDMPPRWYWSTVQNHFQFIDWMGAAHNFSNGTSAGVSVSDCSTYGSSGFTLLARDRSGIMLLADGLDSYRIQFPNGTIVSPPLNTYAGPASVVDNNGNEITTTDTSFVDTTGNMVLTLGGSGTSSSPRTLTYPTYVSGAASTAYATIHYGSYNVQTNFGCSGISEYSATSLSLVDYVQLADGSQYQFVYESTPGYSGKITGRLATVTLPTGGRINYSYSGGSNGIVCQDGGTATLTRSMPDDPASSSWTYTRTPGSSGAANSHTDVADGMSNHANYDFVNDTTDANLTPFVVSHKQYQGAATGTPLLSELTCYNGATTCVAQSLTLPITAATITTTLDGASVKKAALSYNSYGLLVSRSDYDFGSSSPGSLLQIENWSYLSSYAGYVTQDQVTDASANVLSQVNFTYDGYALTSTSGLPQHVSVSGSRGNLTGVSGTTSDASYHYDDAGQLLSSQDVRSNTTSYQYDSATDTFPYQTTLPAISGTSLTSGATYDAASGVLLSSTDANSQSTTYTYDNMLRQTSATYPDGGYVTAAYSHYVSPSTSATVTQGVLHATGGATITTVTTLDPYSRAQQVSMADGSSTDYVQYGYDANGKLYSATNPYRTTSDSTYGVAYGYYDGLGRTTSIHQPDGASVVGYAYSGNATTITDEASNQRKVLVDGLGRTSQVQEPDGTGAFNYITQYLYYQNYSSGPGSYQTIVQQKGGSTSSALWRQRTFTQNGIGQLLSEATPEAGTTTYAYTNSGYCAGNLTLPCVRTDNIGTATTYTYDADNRLTGKSYSSGSSTSAISYSYDQSSYNGLTISYGKGQRTGMSDGSGQTAWSFDKSGRVAAVRKTIGSVTAQSNSTYNQDGTINTLQDFAGTTLTYSYDGVGRQTGVSDGTNTYASGATYNAASLLTGLTHHLTSSSATYTRTLGYNPRLQPATISTVNGSTTVQSFSYSYGGSGTNNGNITAITNGLHSDRSQTFAYDNLNRLTNAGDGAHWRESYTYDPWGNMTDRGSGAGFNWSVTAYGSNQLSNLTYDGDGRVTQDQFGTTVTYDAEGRMLTAGIGTFVYDGDGNRVQKTVSGTPTLYWPSTVAGVSDESNSAGTSFGRQVYLAGVHIYSENTSGNGRFLLQDQLGSPRITVSPSGTVLDDIDYLPFGDPIGNWGSSPTDNHYSFAGYESDTLENSTNYAVFRNLSESMARFNRPDPYMGSYDLNNPQSLNRYGYVLNSPMIFVDPTGLNWAYVDGCLEYWDGDISDNNTLTDYGCGGPGSPPSPRGGGSGAGGGGGGTGNAPNNTGCFVKGLVSGAVGAAVVGGVAAGAVALGVVSAPVATAVLTGAAVIGGGALLINSAYDYATGNSAGLAYNAGSLLGGAVVGGLGARITYGQLSPGQTFKGLSLGSLKAEFGQMFNPKMGPPNLNYWGTGPTSWFAAGGPAAAGAGASTAKKGGC